MPRYQFDELPCPGNDSIHIRLFTLQPGDERDALRCTIRNATITLPDPKLDYEALSYYWGDPTPTTTINIDKAEDEAFLPLHSNLYNALKGLRYRDKERVLWTDAICIDQENIDERTAQVCHMHHIYRAASHLVIWLSEPPLTGATMSLWNPRKAFKTMEYYYQISIRHPDLPVFGSPGTVSTWVCWRVPKYRPSFVPHGRVEHVQAILACEWWTRVWILQEAACARKATLLCDNGTSMDFEHFMRGIKFCLDKGLISSSTFSAQFGSYRIPGSWSTVSQLDAIKSSTKSSDASLLEYLIRLSGSQCLDPRDKIFGLFGISEICSQSGLAEAFQLADLKPNYRVEASTLYIAVAKKCLEMGNLDILSRPICYRHKVWDLPSWVPDWSASDPIESLGMLAATRRYGASKTSSTKPVLIGDSQCVVSGLMVGTIADVVKRDQVELPEFQIAWQSRFIMRELRKLLFQGIEWETQYYGTSETYKYTDEKFADVWWSVIDATRVSYERQWFQPLANRRAVRDDEKSRKTLQRMHGVVKDYGPMSFRKLLMRLIRRHKRLIHPYRISLYDKQMLRERNTFVTKSGHFGIGPSTAIVGDEIVILKGSSVPLIMRPHPDKKATFELIGDAYVHGMMQGEVFDEEACTEITLE